MVTFGDDFFNLCSTSQTNAATLFVTMLFVTILFVTMLHCSPLLHWRDFEFGAIGSAGRKACGGGGAQG